MPKPNDPTEWRTRPPGAPNGLNKAGALGAETDAAERAAVDALYTAAYTGDRAGVLQALAQGAPVDAPCLSNGTTALWHAACNGHVDIVRLLIDAGADANVSDHQGIPLVMEAVVLGRGDVVEALIAGGADVNRSDFSRRTALMAAVERAHHSDARAALVDRLLAAGADLNAQDQWGRTPLMEAIGIVADGGGAEIDRVRRFLRAGARVNTERRLPAVSPESLDTDPVFTDSEFWDDELTTERDRGPWQTPLWWAMRYGHPTVFQDLLAAGADWREILAGVEAGDEAATQYNLIAQPMAGMINTLRAMRDRHELDAADTSISDTSHPDTPHPAPPGRRPRTL